MAKNLESTDESENDISQRPECKDRESYDETGVRRAHRIYAVRVFVVAGSNWGIRFINRVSANLRMANPGGKSNEKE